MNPYASIIRMPVPQSEPLQGQVANNGGGFSFVLDKWKRLDRFLILGSEGGSYYVGERKLTLDNVACLRECVAEDGVRVIKAVVDVSLAGRAPKNDPALLALAVVLKTGSLEAKKAAHDAVPLVARTGTHLFHLAEMVQALGGWGRLTAHAFGDWYRKMPSDRLAFQAMKYQQRDGWTHSDVLRLSHPKPDPYNDDTKKNDVISWMLKGWESVGAEPHPDAVLARIWAFERVKMLAADVKASSDLRLIIDLIEKYQLPHECVPNELKNKRVIWAALLPSMGITALIRNLGKLTNVGAIGPMTYDEESICSKLTDVELLTKGRVHPLSLLVALKTYAQGKGDKGKLTWTPNQKVVDALDAAFYLAFKAIEPTGKRHLLALDVSGSMGMDNIAGMPITPREASAAMALVTANVEDKYHFFGFAHSFIPLKISPRQRLRDAVSEISGLNFGATDCSLPMKYALENKIPVDVFCVYTDSETNTGQMHTAAALEIYRQKMGIGAKLVVIGMTATEFTVADPNDAGSLDVVGFDTATPAVLADFARA